MILNFFYVGRQHTGRSNLVINFSVLCRLCPYVNAFILLNLNAPSITCYLFAQRRHAAVSTEKKLIKCPTIATD